MICYFVIIFDNLFWLLVSHYLVLMLVYWTRVILPDAGLVVPVE